MKLFSCLSILSFALLLSGCASYTARPLNQPPQAILTCPYNKSEEIFVAAKKYNPSDCKFYLDRNVIEQGYQPIQLYIQNNTSKNYLFSVDRISIPCINPYAVARTVHTSTVGRAVGYGVAGLIIWPFLIPAVVDGVKSANANDALDCDYSAKTACDQTISSYSYLNKILFVPRAQCLSPFTITLIDQCTNEPRVLTVNLN